MNVKVLKCPECRGNLEIETGLTVCYCKYCGAQITLEEDEMTIRARARQKEMDHESDMRNKEYSHESDMRDKEYSHEIKKIKIEKKEKRLSEMWPFLMMGVIILLCFGGIAFGDIGQKIQENKLEKTVSEVMELIDAGEYDEAYVKAQSIYWDSGWTSEPEEKWNTMRESLLETILEAKLADGSAIKMPASAKDYESENYEDVIEKLTNLGFSNIQTEIIYDLITGWLVSDGDVESVSIDGNTKFDKGDVVSADAKVVVTYHTFKKNKP